MIATYHARRTKKNRYLNGLSNRQLVSGEGHKGNEVDDLKGGGNKVIRYESKRSPTGGT